MPRLITQPYLNPNWSNIPGDLITTGAGGRIAYVMDDDACYPPPDAAVKNFLSTLSARDVQIIHEATAHDEGEGMFGAMDALGATSAGILTGSMAMGKRYNQRLHQLQALLDRYRTASSINKRQLKQQIESIHRSITTQFSQEIAVAARHRSSRPARNPYLNPQRAMNIASSSRRHIILRDNLDIRRLQGLVRYGRYIGGVGTVVAIGSTTYNAFDKAQRGEAWKEETIVSGGHIVGAMVGASVVTFTLATGPVGWVILGAGAAGLVGSVLGGMGAKQLFKRLLT